MGCPKPNTNYLTPITPVTPESARLLRIQNELLMIRTSTHPDDSIRIASGGCISISLPNGGVVHGI